MEEELTELEKWAIANNRLHNEICKFAPLVLDGQDGGLLGVSIQEVLDELHISAEFNQYRWLYEKYRSAIEIPSQFGFSLLSTKGDIYMAKILENLEKAGELDSFKQYIAEYGNWLGIPTPKSQEV